MSTIFREIEGQLDQIPVSRETVEAFLARMEQDLRTSEKLRNEDPAWALVMQAEHLRRMRHRTVYGGIYTPSQSDVDAALGLARRLAAVLAKAARAALTRKPGKEPSKK